MTERILTRHAGLILALSTALLAVVALWTSTTSPRPPRVQLPHPDVSVNTRIPDDALPAGEHETRETRAPDGYILNERT